MEYRELVSEQDFDSYLNENSQDDGFNKDVKLSEDIKLVVGKQYLTLDNILSMDERLSIPKDVIVKVYGEKEGIYRVIYDNLNYYIAINVNSEFNRFEDKGYLEGFEPVVEESEVHLDNDEVIDVENNQ